MTFQRRMRVLGDFIQAPVFWAARIVYGRHPRRPERNPLQFALCAAIFILNFPTAVGLQPLPVSLAQTPDAFGKASSLVTVVGAGMVLVGLCWRDRDGRLLIEQVGLAAFGVGLLFYGAALLSAYPWDATSTPVSLAWGVSLGTGLRYAQISWFLRTRTPE